MRSEERNARIENSRAPGFVAVCLSIATTAPTGSPGWCDRISPTTPAACGAAIDVPFQPRPVAAVVRILDEASERCLECEIEARVQVCSGGSGSINFFGAGLVNALDAATK